MVLGNIGSVVPPFVHRAGAGAGLRDLLAARGCPRAAGTTSQPALMVLPIALLTFINVATIARVMRGSLIEVMPRNFIRTARAKGLPTRMVVLRHALKPALMPVVSLIGPAGISSITAALVTEIGVLAAGPRQADRQRRDQSRLHAGARASSC